MNRETTLALVIMVAIIIALGLVGGCELTSIERGL